MDGKFGNKRPSPISARPAPLKLGKFNKRPGGYWNDYGITFIFNSINSLGNSNFATMET